MLPKQDCKTNTSIAASMETMFNTFLEERLGKAATRPATTLVSTEPATEVESSGSSNHVNVVSAASAGVVVQTTNIPKKLRTVEEVEDERRLKHGLLSVGQHFPVGPFPSKEAIVDAIRSWAANPFLDGGAFGITKESQKTATVLRGRRRLLLCDRSGPYRYRGGKTDDATRPEQVTKKCDCPWGVWIEEVLLSDGIAVRWVPTCLMKRVITLAKEVPGITKSDSIHSHPMPQNPWIVPIWCSIFATSNG